MAEAKSSSRNKIYAFGVIGLLAIVSVLYYLSAPVYLYVIVYMWFGFTYGMWQQYGRFCFASAWRDLIMVKVPRMFVGIMIGVMTLSIISAWLFVQYPNFYHASPLGAHELIGGFLFGLGMVLAGGCATGSLYKTGEGNLVAFVVLLSLSFSQAIFVALPIFDPMMNRLLSTTITGQFLLSDKVFGAIAPGTSHSFIQNLIANSVLNTIVIGMIFLVAVYAIVVRKRFLKQRTATLTAEAGATADGGQVKTGIKDDLAGFWSMITGSRRTTIAAVALGIIAAFQVFTMNWMRDQYDFQNFGQVMTGQTTSGEAPPPSWNFKPRADQASENGTMFDPGYWYITTQEAMFGAWAIESGTGGRIDMKGNNYFGQINGIPKPWNSPALLLSIGLIFGASVMALWNREFRWKYPNKELFLYAVIGGTLMGMGSRIALGCNIGGFYTRAAFGNVGGWIFFIGMGVGALVAAKLVNYFANRKMAKQMDVFDIQL